MEKFYKFCVKLVFPFWFVVWALLNMDRCAAMSEFLVSTFDQFLQHDTCVGKGNALRIWPGLLDTLYPNLQGVADLSRKLALVCERAFAVRLRPHVKHHHFVEFWCGTGNLTKALLSFGFEGVGLDVTCSEEHNCLMSSGLRLWMNLLMSIIEHGLCWMGPPCSSFVILCLAQSQRYDFNAWWGDASREFVRHAHADCCPCLSAGMCCGATSLFGTTCQQLHVSTTSNVLCPVICQSQQDQNISWSFWWPNRETFANLGNRAAYSQLLRQRSDACVSGTSLVTRNDNGSFTGVKDLLVESGAYTSKFGQHVSKIFAEGSSKAGRLKHVIQV